jgi:uncharacterized protein (TIGR03435 family)
VRYNPQPGTDQQGDQPSIFAAVEEQLGLKLQAERERPTED